MSLDLPFPEARVQAGASALHGFRLRQNAVAIRGAVLALGLSAVAAPALAQSQASSSAAAAPKTAATTLAPVEVTADAERARLEAIRPAAGGQLARGGTLGILGSNNSMDVPFSTTNYTSEYVENQQAQTLADVVTTDASVRTATAAGGFGEDFVVRGFPLSSQDVGLNGLYGLSSSRNFPTALVERVEVLKGPGALMNGIAPSGNIGGVINVVSKRAGDTPLTRVTGSWQSGSSFGVGVDAGRRFGEKNEWGVRVNALHRDGEASVEGGDQRTGLGALALDYRGKKLRWSLDAYQQIDDNEVLRPQIGFATGIAELPSAPAGDRNFYPGNALKSQTSTVASRLEYDISRGLTVYGAAGYRYEAIDQVFPRTSALTGSGDFTVSNNYYDSFTRTRSAEAGLRSRFDTGGIFHTVVASVSQIEQEGGNIYLQGNSTASNIYNPSQLPSINADRVNPRKASDTTLSSVAVADTLSFADDRVLLTVGARRQSVQLDNYNQTTGATTSSYDRSAVSPLAGIVFKPLSNVSLYANYAEGLTRGATAPATAANAGEVFKPYKSKQYEAGVKGEFGALITQATLYQLSRPNAITDPASNVYGMDGEQRNRGLELSAFGEVMPGLRMMTSAAFIQARLSRTAGGVNQGNKPYGTPERAFNVGLDWDTPWVKGLSLNGRAAYTSEVFVNNDNRLRVPGWTRYDIGARYRTAVAGKAVVLRGSVENLFDKKQWLISGNSYATLVAPRTYVLSASVDF